ncbi:MAG: hypothetical protein LQ340_001658 [Diploschistes diacapsis]|nr:MAG: hypothetical protein LQ340_001658 [Diploschistes diacapsis]
MAWLNRVAYWEDFQQAISKRLQGTGQWLLEHPVFQQWLDLSHSFPKSLWISGAPGSGKTVLSTIVVEHLEQLRSGTEMDGPLVAYFYCYSADKKKISLLDICASILAQILAQVDDIPEIILSTYQSAKAYGRTIVSSSDHVFSMFEQVVRSLPALYLVIDGLDESENVTEITRSFTAAAQALPSLHLICLSRNVLGIRRELDKADSIHVDAISTKLDIDRYLKKAVDDLPYHDDNLKERMFTVFSRKADGMFLYAHLCIQTLQSTINMCEMTKALDELPHGLDNVYGLLLDRLRCESSARQEIARRVFLWICGSASPLHWEELQCALSWDGKRKVFCK